MKVDELETKDMFRVIGRLLFTFQVRMKQKLAAKLILVNASFQVPEGFTKVDSLHLSLSRTLYVKEMHKDLLIQQLQKALRTVHLPKEPLVFSKPAKYVNDEGTCRFLALDLEEEAGISSDLVRIVKLIDGVLKGFALPSYYDQPRFHVSIGWRLDDWSVEELSNLPVISAPVDEILMKCGNKILKIC